MKSPHSGKEIPLPVTEKLKSVPEFLGIRVNEEPKFEVVDKSEGVEVRRYAPVTLVSVTVDGGLEQARERAFKRLAAFLFGENSDHRVMAMTSPVWQHRDPVTSAGLTMSFFVPVEMKDIPIPEDPSLRIEALPERLVASYPYGGDNDEAAMEEGRRTLQKWLADHPEYRAEGQPYWAQYDAPFVLPFAKKNEAQQVVARVS